MAILEIEIGSGNRNPNALLAVEENLSSAIRSMS